MAGCLAQQNTTLLAKEVPIPAHHHRCHHAAEALEPVFADVETPVLAACSLECPICIDATGCNCCKDTFGIKAHPAGHAPSSTDLPKVSHQGKANITDVTEGAQDKFSDDDMLFQATS